MATESSLSEPPTSETAPSSRVATLRSRAFLSDLPDDFLNPTHPTTTATDGRRQGHSGVFGDPHLVPMTYGQQAVPSYGRPQDAGNLGRLKVTICQAKLIKNYGWTRMDPYCRVRIGHSVYETPTDVNGSKNPRWNKSFSCNLPRGVNSLYIEIFNERYLALDDRIAWAYFEFTEELLSGETVEEWITLNGKQGDGQEGTINVILSFTPAPPQASYQLTAYGGQPIAMVPGVYGYPPPQGYYPQPQGYVGQPYAPQGYPPVQQPPQGGQRPTPQPARPQIKEEDIKQLQEMFPTVDKEVIQSVLEASNGQVDPAVTNLLQMTH